MSDREQIEKEIAQLEREISVNRGILDCGVHPKQRARINARLESLESKRIRLVWELSQ